MKVDTGNPQGGSYEHEGAMYFFCGCGYRLDVEEDPKGYLSGKKNLEL